MTLSLPVVAGCLCGSSILPGIKGTAALKAGVPDRDWESSLSHADAPRPAIPLARQVNKDYSFPKTLSFPYQGVGPSGSILQ